MSESLLVCSPSDHSGRRTAPPSRWHSRTIMPGPLGEAATNRAGPFPGVRLAASPPPQGSSPSRASTPRAQFPAELYSRPRFGTILFARSLLLFSASSDPDAPRQAIRGLFVQAMPPDEEQRAGAGVWIAFLARSVVDPDLAAIIRQAWDARPCSRADLLCPKERRGPGQPGPGPGGGRPRVSFGRAGVARHGGPLLGRSGAGRCGRPPRSPVRVTVLQTSPDSIMRPVGFGQVFAIHRIVYIRPVHAHILSCFRASPSAYRSWAARPALRRALAADLAEVTVVL
jgi:hypothetical protein